MGKENLYKLGGKLIAKPSSTTSYFRTRREMALKLATAKVNGLPLFDSIGDMKLEDDKFTIPCRMNTGAVFGKETEKDPVLATLSEGMKKEIIIDNLGIELEKHFGLGKGEYPENMTPEKRKEEEDANRVRLEKMKGQGIIMPSHFTGFESVDYES